MIVIAGVWFLWPNNSAEAPIVPEVRDVDEAETPVACTMDAKMCPDGSYVGRTGPKCEFEACPTEDSVLPPAEGLETWETSVLNGVKIRYPAEFGITYTRPVTWPPQIAISTDAYTCTPGGTEIDETGKTEKRNVNGQEFCKTVQIEGAAGSVYRTYRYQTMQDGAHLVLSFATQSAQCANFPGAEKTTCENEALYFDLDSVIYRMFEMMELR